MESGQEFVDYYALLQVNPTCDAKMLEKAYRHFAQMYHPDHNETADVTKFQEVIEAYKVLRDPEMRARYDVSYRSRKGTGPQPLPDFEGGGIDERAAIGDGEVHQKILQALYKQRREHSEEPGVIGYNIKEMLDCSEDSYQFHVWYLKQKGFIEVTEQGTLAITVDGVDHVITTSRTAEAEKLLLSQSHMKEQ